MRKYVFMILAMISLATFAQPQWQGHRPPQGQHQQKPQFTPEQFVKEMKSFITSEAKLTQDEADRFFPMLFEMQEKTRQIQKQRRDLTMKAFADEQKMTEAQYAKLVEEICKLEVTEKQVEQNYYKKFHTVLSWKKVYKVRNAINIFHMRAINMFSRGRRPDMSGAPKGGGGMPPK